MRTCQSQVSTFDMSKWSTVFRDPQTSDLERIVMTKVLTPRLLAEIRRLGGGSIKPSCLLTCRTSDLRSVAMTEAWTLRLLAARRVGNSSGIKKQLECGSSIKRS